MEGEMMTNGYHFMGPPRCRPRGSSPFHCSRPPQYHQQSFRQTMTGGGVPSRFRFPQNYPIQNHNMPCLGPGPQNGNNGGSFQYRYQQQQQPYHGNGRRLEEECQYYFPDHHHQRLAFAGPGPSQKTMQIREYYRRGFRRGRNVTKISSGSVPDASPIVGEQFIKIKREPDENVETDEKDGLANVVCGNGMENESIQPGKVWIKQEDPTDDGALVGTGAMDVSSSGMVLGMAAIKIKQDKDDADVAVGSAFLQHQVPFQLQLQALKNLEGEGSDYSIHSSDEENLSPNSSQKMEEYEPENPGIFGVIGIGNQMASCDEDGFFEAWVAVCISSYPSTLGRRTEVAGYGVWFAEGSKSNFFDVLAPSRPQNKKAVMIHASARALDFMKAKGFSRVRINLETEYLNKNVIPWISKYMENPTAQSSNWDEFKYHSEILELCAAAQGMVIKWSHCSESSAKKSGLSKAKIMAKRATDAWMKDLKFREEAVGTS